MIPETPNFKDNARRALADAQLQSALGGLPGGLVAQRTAARSRLPEFEDLREAGRDLRNDTLDLLDTYLEIFEENATAAGANVHWAETAGDACRIILDICKAADARLVTKGKSMISEEIGLNAYLERAGLEVIETDLGEYILQIRGETPSHIIAPAIHLTQDQVEQDFRREHTGLPADRRLVEPAELVGEARQILRRKFIEADVGITGANFLIAETGSSIIVTNEGNGDLTQSLARIHIVITSIDKVLATREDLATILRLLARSATGQECTTYATLSTGPRRDGDPDGPEAYHVVLLDNGRAELLGTRFREVLRCIRCGACMNHCPVYLATGGHAYGWVYVGPMGSVLTPQFIGIDKGHPLPNASTFCGKCEEVCPVRIPLPKLMRHWREEQHERKLTPPRARLALAAWAFLARRPRLYHLATGIAMRVLGILGARDGFFSRMPLAGGWTVSRELPAPQGATFMSRYRRKGGRVT